MSRKGHGTEWQDSEESDSSNLWSTYMTECYVNRKPPPLTTFAVDKIEQLAREKLKDNISGVAFVSLIALSLTILV